MSDDLAVTVLVVAKAPWPGAVKTRLAADLGDVGAAEVAAAALLDTLQVTAQVFSSRVLALAGDLADSGVVDTADLTREICQWQVIGQAGGDLGQRLASAHAAAGQLGGTGDGLPARVLQIGMDTPQVTARLLRESAALLSQPGVDAILGLAEDGGWWVCGTSDPVHSAALADVPMSRPDTGDLTLAALRATGARVSLVPGLRDLDTLEDAKAISVEHLDLHVSVELRSQGVG